MTYPWVKLGDMTQQAPAARAASRVSGDTQDAHKAFADALGDREHHDPDAIAVRPLTLDCGSPLPKTLRVYLYRATAPESERKEGTFRIQVTGLASAREPGHLDWSNDGWPLLAGYEPNLGAFILWDAGIYDQGTGIVWSRNVQVSRSTILEAMAQGIAEETRHLRGQVDEVVVACTASHLEAAVARRLNLTIERLVAGRQVK
ncbi:MAG TPA: hypothetical protein PLB21_08885 [Actinomycetota bacterium]|nr:hypothetical protein [Actinomycetota bacterium]